MRTLAMLAAHPFPALAVDFTVAHKALHTMKTISTLELADIKKIAAAAEAEALVWALERGSRSGRVAQQFARDYAGRSPEGPPTATARPRIADIAGLSDGAEI